MIGRARVFGEINICIQQGRVESSADVLETEVNTAGRLRCGRSADKAGKSSLALGRQPYDGGCAGAFDFDASRITLMGSNYSEKALITKSQVMRLTPLSEGVSSPAG